MKLTTQLAVVICVGILAGAGLVYGLAAYAHWSDGAVVGLVGAAGVALGTLIAQMRGNAKLADQDKTLDKIVTQTNGKADAEIRRIALEAVAEAKRQGLL